MSMVIVEMTLKCRVPCDEVEDHIIRLRCGEERLPVPAGFVCKDAFVCSETSDSDTVIVRAGYGVTASSAT
jgi:hypothetical protein